jgi:S-DNA-T family DNA segregation ATPase FtsK/SpoIIIE
LPRTVDLADLAHPTEPADPTEPSGPAGRGPADGVALGVGGDPPIAVHLPLGSVPGSLPGLLVLGPPGSGRTTALLTIATGLRRSGRSVRLLTPDPAGAMAAGFTNAGVDPIDATAESTPQAILDPHALAADLLVEDPLVADLDDALATRARYASAARAGCLVVAAEPAAATAAFRGPIPLLRAVRTGLVLGPGGPGAGDALGVRLPVDPDAPPGRGSLVRRGRVIAVQVADPTRREPIGASARF